MFTGVRHERQSQRKSKGKQDILQIRIHKERSKSLNAPQISTVLVTSTLQRKLACEIGKHQPLKNAIND